MKYGIQTLEYKDGEKIPSAIMGDGSVGVVDILKNKEGFVGVAFYPAPQNTVIGEFINPEAHGKPVTRLGIKVQLLFDKAESIDVVVAKLQAARESLTAESE